MRQLLGRGGRDEAVEDELGGVLAHLLERVQQRQGRVRSDGALHLPLSGQRARNRLGRPVDLVLELVAHDADQLGEDDPLAHRGQIVARRRRPPAGDHARRGQFHILHERLGAPVGAGRQSQGLVCRPPARHPPDGQEGPRQGERCHAAAVLARLGVGVGQDDQIRAARAAGPQRRVAAHDQPRRPGGLHRRRDRRALRRLQPRHAAGPIRQSRALGKAGPDAVPPARGAPGSGGGARRGGSPGCRRSRAGCTGRVCRPG